MWGEGSGGARWALVWRRKVRSFAWRGDCHSVAIDGRQGAVMGAMKASDDAEDESIKSLSPEDTTPGERRNENPLGKGDAESVVRNGQG